MNKSHNHKVGLARGAQLLTLLAAGCSGEPEPEEQFRESAIVGEAEASLENELRTLDSDDIVISYDERSASMEVGVDLDQFAELARGFTVEMNVEVKLPDGTVARHELDWTSGEDLEVPRIALPAAKMGRYEMALTSLAINGRIILDGPAPLRSMELLAEESPAAQELQVGVPAGDWTECKDGGALYGGPGNDILFGTKCSDSLFGGGGNDVFLASGGVDVCYGGPGDDQFFDCEVIFQD